MLRRFSWLKQEIVDEMTVVQGIGCTVTEKKKLRGIVTSSEKKKKKKEKKKSSGIEK